MTTKIIFDETSSSQELNFEFNKFFAKSQPMFIRDIYKVRDYMYLSTIYENFGFIWNPYNENVSWIYDRDENQICQFDMMKNLITKSSLRYYAIQSKNLKPLTMAFSFSNLD